MTYRLPNEDIGAGQHSRALWRAHMAELARMRSAPYSGHGYGVLGSAAFEVPPGPGNFSAFTLQVYNMPSGCNAGATAKSQFEPVRFYIEVTGEGDACHEYFGPAATDGFSTGQDWQNIGIALNDIPIGSHGLIWIGGVHKAIVNMPSHADSEDTPADSEKYSYAYVNNLGALTAAPVGEYEIIAAGQQVVEDDNSQWVSFVRRRTTRARYKWVALTGSSPSPAYGVDEFDYEFDGDDTTWADSTGAALTAQNQMEPCYGCISSAYRPPDPWHIAPVCCTVWMEFDTDNEGNFSAKFAHINPWQGDCS